jgi:5'-phosphate synthase pdxT subunit
VTSPTIGVFALQGDVREHLRVLTELAVEARPVRRLEELEQVDALVLPGGESTTMAKLAVAFDLLEPLQKRVADGMPVYGSCAGMILLADRIEDGIEGQPTIGGLDVVVRRNAFGRQVDSFEGQVDLVGVDGGPMAAVFIRAPWVESVGPDVQVLARLGTQVHSLHTGEGPGPAATRIVAVRQGPLLATAFHPEMTSDPRVHALFLQMVRERS